MLMSKFSQFFRFAQEQLHAHHDRFDTFINAHIYLQCHGVRALGIQAQFFHSRLGFLLVELAVSCEAG